MTHPSKFDLLTLLPGVQVLGRTKRVEIRLVPALNDIVGFKSKNTKPSDNTYVPARTLFLTKNQDGTYAVINRLELIEPEVARTTEKWVVAVIVQFTPDQAEREASFRAFLQVVEPARRCVSVPQLIKALLKGSLDRLARFYATDRCIPGCWGMYRGFFSNNELPKSTFDRLKKPKAEQDTPSSKNSESKIDQESSVTEDRPETPETPSENNNRKPPASTPEAVGQEDPSETDKISRSNETDTHPEGKQHELFDKFDESDESNKID
jgi:hypothetical protein